MFELFRVYYKLKMVDVVSALRIRIGDLEKSQASKKILLKQCDEVIKGIDEIITTVPHRIRFSLEAFRVRVKSLISKTKSKSQDFIFEEIDCVFQNRIVTGLYTNVRFKDVNNFFDGIQKHVKNYVKKFIRIHHCIKASVVFCARFNNGKTEENKVFNSRYEEICETTDFDGWYTDKIKDRVILLIDDDTFKNGSNWKLVEILYLQLHLIKFNPMRAGSYVELPQYIKAKKACINVKTYDSDCFAVSLISSFFPIKSNSEDPFRYPDWRDYLNFDGIEEFPVPIKNIPKFEKLNNVSINVFMIEHKKINPVHLTKLERQYHRNLLLITDTAFSKEEMSGHNPNIYHYVWIKDLSKLVSRQLSLHNGTKKICNRCLHYFSSSDKLMNHKIDCMKLNKCAVKLPSPQDNVLEFKQFNQKLKVPFMVYADSETLLRAPGESDPPIAYQKHCLYSIAYRLVCDYDPSLTQKTKILRGRNCARKFYYDLRRIAFSVRSVCILFILNTIFIFD